MRVLIKNPVSGRSNWFSLPFYFGKLVSIGHSGNYDDEVEILEIDGNTGFPLGFCTLHELEKLNALAER